MSRAPRRKGLKGLRRWRVENAMIKSLVNNGFDKKTAEKIYDTLRSFPPPGSTVAERLLALRNLGFTDPWKLITNYPNILCLTTTNTESKVAFLRELGFAEPIKIAEYFPAILGYSHRRLMTYSHVIMGLARWEPWMFCNLLRNTRYDVIKKIAPEKPTTWSELCRLIRREYVLLAAASRKDNSMQISAYE
ncbi:MAG: hypothetical protein U1A72_13360 [Sulfuritalea sp.]|nr:hypothetical protein [Sulfuritalea sp.]